MKEITQEIKKQIFCLYYDQFILGEPFGSISTNNPKYWDLEIDFLLVKPLSSITDEYTIEVAKLVDLQDPLKFEKGKDGSWLKIRDKNGWFIYMCDHFPDCEYSDGYDERTTQLPIYCIDFLRSKGYALPAYGFTVQELIDANVFKLIDP